MPSKFNGIQENRLMEAQISSAELEDSKQRLNQLKGEKGRLSRLIGECHKSGKSADDLIKNLQQISVETKKLQKHIKKELNHTHKYEWTPKTLEVPPAICSKSVTTDITVKLCGREEISAADAYVAVHPGATIWHRPVVSAVVANTYGHDTHYLCATAGSGIIVGVLPLVRINSKLFGNFLVSLPYFNYGGLLADNFEIARELVRAGDEWREETKAQHLELRFLQDNKLGLPQKTRKVTFWLPLPSNTEDLWDSFKPKTRAQIRRGEREMTELDIGGKELLDDFYRVFSVNMRDLGTPVYSRYFFRNLLKALEGNAWIVIARINRKPVGCAFLTGYRNRMEVPWASTLRSYAQTSVNMGMYWNMLQFAVQKGFGVFDFGRCSEQTGTYKFKQQWGGQPLGLYWDYVLAPGSEIPELNPENPKFKLMIAAWRRLPVWFTNFLGPHIVKAIP